MAGHYSITKLDYISYYICFLSIFKVINMKSNIVLLIAFFSTNIITAGNFKDNYLPVWERATNYTLEVVRAMPADNYDYRATDEVGSFAGLSGHIAGNIFWLTSRLIKDEDNQIDRIEWKELSKEEIISYLKQAFNYVAETVKEINEEELNDTLEFGGETMNKERIFGLMRDHMTHHRAQLILYLRLNKIEPPRYVGW